MTEWDYRAWQAAGYPDSMVTILRAADDVTEEVLVAAHSCAEAAYGMGNQWTIDWERAYDMLESQHGFLVDEMGSPADNKIRRHVRKIGVE